jgi:hypothetical protein
MRGMYLHAERLLAKAGRQGARGGVSPTAKKKRNAGTERAKRSGGLHKRSAEVWGDPLRRARAAPSARFGFRFRAQRRSCQGWALRTGTGPLGRVAEDATRLQSGRRLLPVNELFYGVGFCVSSDVPGSFLSLTSRIGLPSDARLVSMETSVLRHTDKTVSSVNTIWISGPSLPSLSIWHRRITLPASDEHDANAVHIHVLKKGRPCAGLEDV